MQKQSKSSQLLPPEQTIPTPFTKQGLPLLLLMISTLMFGFTFWISPSWKSINEYIDKKYPEVADITVHQLREDILQGASLYLIDVREAEEYAVSHLPGSVNLTNPGLVTLSKDTRIISYCSVGIRSADFTRRLQQKGYTQAVNLRGSIFSWANQGYPLVRGEQPTLFVHPFNERWGILVNSELHRYSVEQNAQ